MKKKKRFDEKKQSSSAKKPQSLRLERVFSHEHAHPLDQVRYRKATSRIEDTSGEVIFEMSEVEVPEGWSQLAVDILVSKYFRKSGVPQTGHEVSVRQVIHRIVRTLSREAEKQGYLDSSSAQVFESELAALLVNQQAAFNSPVWFNLGLSSEYQIQGAPGGFAWDEASHSVQPLTDAYLRPQCSACFIQSVDDDLMSIFQLMKNEALLFKYGSGSGTNFSKLRGQQEKLAGGGTSSGLMSFLDVLDKAAGATKSGGITRRAAKMVCLDLDHPEILDFIQWKSKEERKVAALIQAGYSPDFNGEAYRTVSGQNSNHSVRVNDAFMHALLNDESWSTRSRTTHEVMDTYRAREVWRKLAEAAWACADPGVQYESTIQAWHTCPNSGKINASNPCSEYLFLDDSACNLASLNLLKFLKEDGSFDGSSFRHACRVLILAQEILVDLSGYPTEKIAWNSHRFRPLGLGYANLGALLMVLGLPYDSDVGRTWAATITALMSGSAYAMSAELASIKGAFEGHEENAQPMKAVIGKHVQAVENLVRELRTEGQSQILHELALAAQMEWKHALEVGDHTGWRNAQVTVLAPTGTIGLLMDCDTTGIEPEFALVKVKKLAGGGSFQMINQSVARSLKGLGYSLEQIQDVLDYVVGNPNQGIQAANTLEGAPHLKLEHLPVFDCAVRTGQKGVRFIKPMGHLKMMAAVQPFLSGAISKTVNLPQETRVEEIEEVYLQGWRLGLKAVAVYRDGSKFSQPLIAQGKPSGMSQASHRRALPGRRKGFTQEARISGHLLTLHTSEYEDGTLGEISVELHKEGSLARGLMNALSQAVSLGLQYGVPLEELVHKFTFTRFDPAGVVQGHSQIKWATSVVDYLFRVLGLEYLNRQDLAHLPLQSDSEGGSSGELMSSENRTHVLAGEDLESSNHENKFRREENSSRINEVRYCELCAHPLVREGTCDRCLNCGTSWGCS